MTAAAQAAAGIRELAAGLGVTVTAELGALAAVTAAAPVSATAEADCAAVLARFPVTAPAGWSGTARPDSGVLRMSKGGVDKRLARQFARGI